MYRETYVCVSRECGKWPVATEVVKGNTTSTLKPKQGEKVPITSMWEKANLCLGAGQKPELCFWNIVAVPKSKDI